MITKQSECGIRSQPQPIIKHSQPKFSQQKHILIEVPEVEQMVFDAARIIERYRQMRQIQHNRLSQFNLSQDYKRDLFGFSERRFLTNLSRMQDLIIENHPEKGRIIMSKEKFYLQQLDKREKGQYNSSNDSLNSMGRSLSNGGRKIIELLNDSRFRQNLGQISGDKMIRGSHNI